MKIMKLPAKYKHISYHKKLLARYDKVKITEKISEQFEHLPKCVDSFDYIAVDTKGDKSLIKEVVTLFDNTGKMISRFFLENGITKREHRYTCKDDLFKIEEHILEPGALSANRSGKINLYEGLKWHCSQIFRRFSYYNNGGVIYKIPCKKVVEPVKNSIGPNFARRYTFTMFTDPNDKHKMSKKSFSAVLEGIFERRKKVKITQVSKSDNLDININDEFLPARILGLHNSNGVAQLTNVFLDRKGLLGLNIDPRWWAIVPVQDDRILGQFVISDTGARIVFNEDLQRKMSMLEIISTAGHEADHAFRHALVGRLGEDRAAYYKQARKILGELSPDEKQEAVRCKDANDNYVPAEEDFVLYFDNYLEGVARDAGEKAVEEYTRDRTNYDFFSLFDDM